MTATAHDTDELQQLQDEARRAWKTYSERLIGLNGEQYERVENESWDELQGELGRIERRRELLTQTAG